MYASGCAVYFEHILIVWKTNEHRIPSGQQAKSELLLRLVESTISKHVA